MKVNVYMWYFIFVVMAALVLFLTSCSFLPQPNIYVWGDYQEINAEDYTDGDDYFGEHQDGSFAKKKLN